VKWFGYKIHLLVDTKYEMPLGYRVTRASVSDSPQLLPLVGDLREKHPQIHKDIENLSGIRGMTVKTIAAGFMMSMGLSR